MEIAIAIAGLALSVAGFFIGRFASVKASGREDGEMKADIKHIKNGIESIREDMADMRKDILELRDRVTRLETLAEIDHERTAGHV